MGPGIRGRDLYHPLGGPPLPENRQRRLRSCPGVCSEASPRAGHPPWPGITGLTVREPAAAGGDVPGVLDVGRSQLALDILQAPQHTAGLMQPVQPA